MGRLEGHVALVTGAGEGIGLGIARRMAGDGAAVVVAERNEDTGVAAARELQEQFGVEASFIATDVTDKAQVEAAVRHAVEGHGRLDAVVNNAWGGGTMSRLEHKTDEQMEHGFRMAFWPAYWSMLAAFPVMRDQGRGRIINLCSLNGVNAHPFTAEYNSGKEAVRSLTRTAAREWARHGITANVICPAAATAAYKAVAAADPALIAETLRNNPMGRMGDPEADIGGVAVFLASDDAGYVTGNTLMVDGGSHINGVTWAPDLPD
jgi:NAD(P)-dependent dehydrogenase (short-subunit alcohol dehydrogenase family)